MMACMQKGIGKNVKNENKIDLWKQLNITNLAERKALCRKWRQRDGLWLQNKWEGYNQPRRDI